MCEIISVFPFILTIVFLHHDLAKLKPAWFCSRCSVVSVSSDFDEEPFGSLWDEEPVEDPFSIDDY